MRYVIKNIARNGIVYYYAGPTTDYCRKTPWTTDESKAHRYSNQNAAEEKAGPLGRSYSGDIYVLDTSLVKNFGGVTV